MAENLKREKAISVPIHPRHQRSVDHHRTHPTIWEMARKANEQFSPAGMLPYLTA